MRWGAYEFDHLLFLFRHASIGVHAGHAGHTAWASWKSHGAEVCVEGGVVKMRCFEAFE